MIQVDLISVSQAKEIADNLAGVPAEDRVLVFHSNDNEKRSSGGIIIPGQAQEGIAKKGVVVKVGTITEAYSEGFKSLLNSGVVVVYGNYAGKEIEPKFAEGYKVPAVGKFIVLSINEIIYFENNY